ncbi:MAG: 30S ribosomal protein S12 methylthiotransferase RimO [Thermobispora bispora]|uniref:30S ribosomal protein S12 methylthiotransferase RimO n=1 Tax=Thermobispora bispora TaxID=2006 RepID=UPI0019815454|nr:30S ribosomal protein S12 methylthiotransferase RimO [Thermobispora bispora]MBO2473702.1 30S ribosomal protein S12 methylthiotransferase RimO [Actinomycetales bacterium]MBX6166735.1 30S ribosomal protein S12 methylthiotransferase RimO [Thermobispora bispora]MDI9582091.1 30S ribosomal protein S12 methylthiotransferase RimO [Thermobispora sp.]QSI47714.1 30S ribosomal protein S12 methylthiotransferase RimO [Thermobispora bispora]
MSSRRTVSLITLGCARNEVDSEELAARLEAAGWRLSDDDPDVIVVNTCGFIDSAKKESIDTLLAAADSGAKVVAAGCLAERYGKELAEALPEATVISFDDYAEIGDRLDDVLAGRPLRPHTPRDRRRLLPITPVDRSAARARIPGHGARADEPLPEGVAPASGPRTLRKRLTGGPVAPIKLASGCDRRCAFCAIPAFRGAYVSRPPEDLIAEARWLAEQGVKEIVLVSENSTSYGKDLGDLRALERLLPKLAATEGIERVRVNYLQPAELRPSLIEVLTSTPGVAPYFDLSFQHASGPLLRRMRRFGDARRFLDLLERIRERAPEAGIRSNFIVGFPGETEEDFAELKGFLEEARLDVIGVFGYSDEEGTEAYGFPDKLDQDTIDERVAELSALADELMAQRAEERIGTELEILIEEDLGDGGYEGRAAHQGPEVDGTVTVQGGSGLRPGQIVQAVAVGSEGVDLVARVKAGT